MANVKKFTRAASGHLCSHYERMKDENGEYIKFGNQEIDPNRTCLNYNLAPDWELSQNNFIQKRCAAVQCMNRKDVKVMCSWVVTAPKNLPIEDERKFFEESYKFLSARYGGEENVISAYVHMDENQPHLHFAFVPVVMDKKKNIPKVSAKEVITRAELKVFHQDLENHLAKSFGRELGILNEATKDGNKSIEELKRGQATQDLENARKQLAKIKDNMKHLQATEKGLQAKIEGLEGQILTAKGLESIQPEETVLGNLKGITIEQVKDLKKTSMQYHRLKGDYQELKDKYARVQKLIPTQEENLENAKTASENYTLKQKLQKSQNFISRIPEDVRKQMDNELKQEKQQQKRGHDFGMEL